MDTLLIIISLSVIIIISHFLNIYSDNTGVPSVLILILFGAILQLDTEIAKTFFNIEEWPGILPDKNTQGRMLEVLGIGGLILILLEAALELKINKSMIISSSKAFFAGLFGLIGTSFLLAYLLMLLPNDLDFLHALLYSVPLAIISSAIIIPSIEGFDEEKKSFLIYESTFSDVLGLLMFQVVIVSLATGEIMSEWAIIGKLALSILFSVFISIILIYLFQKIKGHTKLFLLFSVLILLYALGEMLHLSALLIILIFGIILNNYKSVFVGVLGKLIEHEKVDSIQDDFKVIIRESAFVVRTFFFVLFGYYVSFGDLNLLVIIYSLILFAGIYFIRFIILFPIFKGKTWPEVFLSPRGLITILLFFQITDEYVCDGQFHSEIAPGILLFIILGSALTMSNALIGVKKLKTEKILADKLDSVDVNINDQNEMSSEENPNTDDEQNEMSSEENPNIDDEQNEIHESLEETQIELPLNKETDNETGEEAGEEAGEEKDN